MIIFIIYIAKVVIYFDICKHLTRYFSPYYVKKP